jgi:hypothetical protein
VQLHASPPIAMADDTGEDERWQDPLTEAETKARQQAEGPREFALPKDAKGFVLRYASLSQRGYYPDSPMKDNQDSHLVVPNFGTKGDIFFGVFDGHASMPRLEPCRMRRTALIASSSRRAVYVLIASTCGRAWTGQVRRRGLAVCATKWWRPPWLTQCPHSPLHPCTPAHTVPALSTASVHSGSPSARTLHCTATAHTTATHSLLHCVHSSAMIAAVRSSH